MEKHTLEKASEYYWFGSEDADQLPVSQRIELGVQHLESVCSAKVGFQTSISVFPDMLESRVMRPNVLDASMILEILKSADLGVSKEMQETVKRLIVTHMVDGGAWSYFQGRKIIPEDSDTSVACLMGLNATNFDKSKIKSICKFIFDRLDMHANNLPDIALKADRSIKNWQVKPRFDLTVMSNVLYSFCKLGLQHEEKLGKVYQLIDHVLTDETKGKREVFNSFSKNYKEFDIFIFFTSRLVSVSKFAIQNYQPKLLAIIKNRLLISSQNVNIIAGKILAAYYCGLFEDKSYQLLLVKQVKKLIEFQSAHNFGFKESALCVVHENIFVGSGAVSTCLAVSALECARKSIDNLDDMLQEMKE